MTLHFATRTNEVALFVSRVFGTCVAVLVLTGEEDSTVTLVWAWLAVAGLIVGLISRVVIWLEKESAK